MDQEQLNSRYKLIKLTLTLIQPILIKIKKKTFMDYIIVSYMG